MRILLDTHVWLWLNQNPSRISKQGLQLLENESNELFLSAVSAWEISVKYHLGKLPLPTKPAEYMTSRMQLNGVTELSIEMKHTLIAGELPLHHKDPFDRLLIAQAIEEECKLMTVDGQVKKYDVDIIWLA